MNRDADTEAWIDEARRADCWTVLNALGLSHQVKAHPRECVGPCPACGGRDRFSINRRKNIWYCRRSAKGGDAIALVSYLVGADFLGAVETITGRPSPRGEAGRKIDPAHMEELRRASEARQAEAEREANSFRNREIRRAHDIWSSGEGMPGSVAESYLRLRGLNPAPGAKLRSASHLPYWHFVAGEWCVLHTGPAMLAAIQGADDRFIGCHCTYIDLDQPSGKAEIVHPETGEVLPAKKVRGSAKGGHIELSARNIDAGCRRLVLGEGIETVYAVREALREAWAATMAATWFWAGVSLGNIGGRALQSVVHPTATITDAKGRIRRAKVPGPLPDPEDPHALQIPALATEIILLGDGDSDRFTTENVLRRAAARWVAPGRTIRAAWADQGADFNDMLRGAT